MPHFDPPLRSYMAEKPVQILAKDGDPFWMYPGLLDCVLNSKEWVKGSDGPMIDWTAWECDTVGRVLEFMLQFDYSTVITDTKSDDQVIRNVKDQSLPSVDAEAKQKVSKTTRQSRSLKASRPSTNCMNAHSEGYKAKWDTEEPTPDVPPIGPWSIMDSFLTDTVCKDWMMTVEGNILATDAVELSSEAIILHSKIYVFAFAHDFKLLVDVAIQKLVMCLSRLDCTAAVRLAISAAVEVLNKARMTDIHAEHRKIHEIPEHYTALEIGIFLRDPLVANDGFVLRADQKIKAWRQQGVETQARDIELENELARVRAQQSQHGESQRALRDQGQILNTNIQEPLRSGRVKRRW